MKNLYVVGQKHPGINPPIREGGHFNWTNYGADLVLIFEGPTEREILGVRQGECEFALTYLPESPRVVWFLYNFIPGVPWSDAPYNPHVLKPQNQPAVLFPTPNTRIILDVTLVDTCGVIRGLRKVTFSPEFSRVLAELTGLAIQCTTVFIGDGINNVFTKYQTADLLRMATIRASGGVG